MKVAASADLGGLGKKEGSPVTYNWTPPSLIPPMLPWLIMLALLLAKPNRCGQAWWIWLPLLCLPAVEQVAQPLLGSMPSRELELFTEVIYALAFGTAAGWLLAPYLARRHRLLTFLCILATLAVSSLLIFAVRQDWDGEMMAEAIPVVVVLSLSVFVISVAMLAAGWICRRRYRPFPLVLWLGVALVVIWFVMAAPFFIVALIASGGQVPWVQFVGSILAMAGVSLAVLLPFLVLSFANFLFRERLKGLLHLETAVLPPVAPLAPTASPAV